MVKARIATGAEQPINTHAAVAGEVFSQGDLVAVDNTDGKLYKADSDSLVLRMAAGVAMGPADDKSTYASELQPIVEAERALIDRDRVSFVTHGVELENEDDDWNFTPGDVVYLKPGGGFTQTKPAGASGDLVQIVGVALTAERIQVNIVPSSTIA